MRKITKGTLHTSRLISVRESTENSQTGRIIFVVLCPHCGKDPMRDIWQFYSAFFTQRIDQLYDTVINMFVLKKSARRFTKPTYRDASSLQTDRLARFRFVYNKLYQDKQENNPFLGWCCLQLYRIQKHKGISKDYVGDKLKTKR